MSSRPRAAHAARLAVAVVAERRWRRAAAGLGRWRAGAGPRRARGTVVVAVVSDRRMRQLNARFRGKDRVTDVLSFPAGPAGPGGADAPRVPSGKLLNGMDLGEIAIAGGVARRQASVFRHPVAVELRLLALHGLLHLLGYDHERDQGQMRTLEARLRRRSRLPAGLLDRTPPLRTRR